MAEPNKIKVLVVDDSQVVRTMVTKFLSRDPEIEVVGSACDPYEARDRILALNPDVLTLDIEMPRMDGLTFLKIIMEQHPMPVIVISSLSQSGSKIAVEALRCGAVEVLGKPDGSYSVGNLGAQLSQKVKAAAATRGALALRTPSVSQTASTLAERSRKQFHSRQVLLLGASTGGTQALQEILTSLPAQIPGICIVQHIPPYFSKAFAERLNTLCPFTVKEAENGEKVKPGLALIAPGDYHMILKLNGGSYTVNLKQSPMVWHQRPAVDILFESATRCVGRYAVAALLTGMGKDGAEGLLQLKKTGAITYAQDEKTSIVYGMPKTAFELGAVLKMVPLPLMANTLYTALCKFKS